ncbi:hypothetical protein CORC01_01278 [Colletotrichum orchidophilum]|uniref:Uncharacterized protein n=1 Tax=Colletotrichum orchidophilum TaxID=1209926 RepID=A0A1G4BQ39_9PEZI|nr:uncharacterized protein CORC01_01278 [Colletotrichum orchidophilum]OHF03559.1 hypothetical protein CORC01_01278 [Colletotrichum orchidophilum]
MEAEMADETPAHEEMKLTEATFDVKTAPGYMENTYVGHHSWLASWFPYNPEHITIYLGSGADDIRCSIPEPIIVESFSYLAACCKAPISREGHETGRVFEINRDEANAFGLIMSFLMT